MPNYTHLYAPDKAGEVLKTPLLVWFINVAILGYFYLTQRLLLLSLDFVSILTNLSQFEITFLGASYITFLASTILVTLKIVQYRAWKYGFFFGGLILLIIAFVRFDLLQLSIFTLEQAGLADCIEVNQAWTLDKCI